MREIGRIEPGEQVLSYDFKNGEWTYRTVTDRIDNIYEGAVVTIETDDCRIETTIHHPFWVVKGHELEDRSIPRELADDEDQNLSLAGRWVDSHELLAGDTIIGKDATLLVVRGISQRFEPEFPVTNLTIADLHNYTVGTASILVHNTPICEAGQAALRNMLDAGEATFDEVSLLVRGFTNADEVLTNLARGITTFEWHHPWPKYLGGPVKQDLVRLPKHIHDAYHRGLDEQLPRRAKTEFYESLSVADRLQMFHDLASFTKRFDQLHGTSLWEAMLKNGFPGV